MSSIITEFSAVIGLNRFDFESKFFLQCFQGGIVDDIIVYHYEDEKYLLVVNALNVQKDFDWCVKHNMMGVELENASDNMAQLAVQDPKAAEGVSEESDNISLTLFFC